MNVSHLLHLAVLSLLVGCGDAAPVPGPETDQGALGADVMRQTVTLRIAEGAAAEKIIDKVILEQVALARIDGEFISLAVDGHKLECSGEGSAALCHVSFGSNLDPSTGAPLTLLVGEAYGQARDFANALFLGLGKVATGGVRCTGAARRPVQASCEIEGTVTEVRRAGARAGGGYRATGP